MQNLNELTDRELYEKCSFFGTQARKWANKFAALLPEVGKRALYKKHGFYSIFEFAAKLARMNHETVIEILRISRRLESLPLLLELIETQGWSKLKVVATIATKENEKMLAEKVCQMSRSTLAVFVNEIRKQNAASVQIRTGAEVCKNIEMKSAQVLNSNSGSVQQANPQQNLLDCGNSQGENLGSEQSVCEKSQLLKMEDRGWGNSQQSSRIYVRLLLKPKTELRLKELQKKMSKKIHAPVDLNEVMEALLDAYDGGRKHTGKVMAKKSKKTAYKSMVTSNDATVVANTAVTKPAILGNLNEGAWLIDELAKNEIDNNILWHSRYIKAVIKKILHEKYGGRCAFPGCNKLPDIYHHTRRFSLYPNHNPDFLMPLCRAHEQLAHHGLIENEERPAENWRLQLEPDKSAAKYWVDKRVNGFRRGGANNNG